MHLDATILFGSIPDFTSIKKSLNFTKTIEKKIVGFSSLLSFFISPSFLHYLVNAAGTPPSTVIIQPVVLSDLEEAKKAIDSAMSFG
jgi:hypothetical protein